MNLIKNAFNLKVVYILLFLTLTCWALFAYTTMNQLVTIHTIYAELINISGKQRMLSQKTTLISKRVFETGDVKLKQYLGELIVSMKKNHQYILNNLTSTNIHNIYFNQPYSLNNEVNNYLLLLDSFYNKYDLKELNNIQNFSFNLLQKLDYAVSEFEKESKIKTDELKQRGFYILLGIVLTLLIEAIFIIIPSIKKNEFQKNKLKDLNNSLETRIKTEIDKINRQSKELFMFKEAVENVMVGVSISNIVDNEHKIIYVNKIFEEITGYKKSEIIGTNLKFLQGEDKDQDEIRIIKEAMSENKFCSVELKNYKKDGTMFYNSLILSPIFNDRGTLIHYVGIINDITEEKNRERIFEQQNRLASMGEMIGNIAHQWRQPLSVISTGASGIKIKKEYNLLTDKFLLDTCDLIDENAQYLSQTIEDFKNFIKGDSKPIRFDLKNDTKSFLNLVDSTIKKYHIQIILELKEHIAIKGYPNELLQCFINIFNNSKDALVSNTNEDERYIFISQEVINNNIVIKFKDNGGGIPENIIDKIFEPYFSTKHQSQGTGLGLHMTYNFIVNSMKGTIEPKNVAYTFNNKNYKGAEFTIIIPLNSKEEIN